MDNTQKSARIKGLKDEVVEFHPILKNLFANMRHITNVEYTHGTNEKGADFVLTRFDEVLGDTYYIGVIVKIGKIQQDFTDIERQINECELQRFAFNGKKKITLSEIWVVTNDSISNNAEEKIHHNFSNKKISFIENGKIVKLIDQYLPNFWFDYGIKIGQYLENLHNRIVEMDKNLNLVKCSNDSFYIEQDIVEQESEYKKSNKVTKRKKVNIFQVIKDKNIVMIEGGMGAGKSKLLREIVKKYSDGEVYSQEKILPVIVQYNNLIQNYNTNIDNFILSEVDQETLLEHTNGHKILLLVDSIDECNIQLSEQLSSIQTIVDYVKSHKNFNVVFTSRPLHGVSESKKYLGDIFLYEILPLSLTRILDFLYKICQETNLSKRIIEDLKKSQLFKELPKTPVAAMILANLLNENSKELPSNITELYSKYTELMLGRWDIDKGLQSQKEYEASESVAMQLSLYFINNNLSSIGIDETKKIFHEYLVKRNLKIDPLKLYEKVIGRSGLLIENKFSSTVMFKHKTFAEYLYARWFDKKSALPIDEKIYDVYWDTIYFFYIGLKKDCSELLQSIVDLKPNSDAQRFNRIVNMSNYFLAGFSTPYEIISKNLYKVILEASKLYIEIVQGKIDAPFNFFPEIHVLFLFQFFIRENYSYEFFKDAVDELNVNIDDAECTEDEKLYGLFFVGVIAMDLGVKDPFDFLLEKYNSRIPIQLKLALSHEAKRLKHISSYVKKSIKKFHQNTRGNVSLNKHIEILYSKSINSRTKLVGSKQ